MTSGVRWAETIRTSYGTPNSASTSMAACIVGRSLSLPMITPTRGPGPPFSALTGPDVTLARPPSWEDHHAHATHRRPRHRASRDARRHGRGVVLRARGRGVGGRWLRMLRCVDDVGRR